MVSVSGSSSSTRSSRSPVRIISVTGFVDRYVESYHDIDGRRPKVVDMGYGDFDLQIDDTVFKTHRHHLVKFGSFALRLRRALPRYCGTEPIKIDGDQQDVEDMANTFKILYASVISGPFKFEPHILISAFRVAKTYDYPELRTYCIEQLEQSEGDLTPTQRIEFARAFDPDSREVATYDAMCKRGKPFTDAELKILGMLAWSMVTRVRRLEKAKSEPESATEDVVCEYKDDTSVSCEQELPTIPVVRECGWGDEERRAQREKEEEVMNTFRRRDELERVEEEERKKGYEEALQRHQEWRKQEELKVKGRIEEPSSVEQQDEWEEVQEQEWKGQGLDCKVGETSSSPIKGKNNAATRAFSALSSRYLAVAGRICGKPDSVVSPGTKDDSTLFEECADESKYYDFDEKKRLI